MNVMNTASITNVSAIAVIFVKLLAELYNFNF
jgi:hypothetical protein